MPDDQGTTQTDSSDGASDNQQAGTEQVRQGNVGETVQTNEPMIPKHRWDEVNKRMKEAERRLASHEREKAAKEEEQAAKSGEWQKVAEKHKKTIEQKDARIKELETQQIRDARYRAFVGASQGVILPEAVDDAFAMLTEEEFRGADTEDVNTYRVLADGLAERKPYLSDGVRGAGSGGSARPVFSGAARGAAGANGARTAGGRSRAETPFKKTRDKPPFR